MCLRHKMSSVSYSIPYRETEDLRHVVPYPVLMTESSWIVRQAWHLNLVPQSTCFQNTERELMFDAQTCALFCGLEARIIPHSRLGMKRREGTSMRRNGPIRLDIVFY